MNLAFQHMTFNASSLFCSGLEYQNIVKIRAGDCKITSVAIYMKIAPSSVISPLLTYIRSFLSQVITAVIRY